MSSPFALYISPSHIEIDVLGPDLGRVNVNNVATGRQYRISNSGQFSKMFLPSQREKVPDCIQGWLSPIFSVTLPPATKMKAGIPLEAAYYCYLHAPDGLASTIDWDKFNNDGEEVVEKPLISSTHDMDIANISLLGAYVYFNKYLDVIRVNALALKETEYKLKLSGPFRGKEGPAVSIYRLNRVHPVYLNAIHEAGVVGSAWVRPRELFGLDAATDDHSNSHGGFAFFLEDGSYKFYAIDSKEKIDPDGAVDTIPDCFQASQQQQFSNTLESIGRDHDVATERFQILLMEGSDNPQKQERPRSPSFLKRFIFGTDKRDPTSWSALHYACRYYPENLKLIQKVINEDPQSVFLSDHYGRYPLHIACFSKASDEVIAAILSADSKKEAVAQKTRSLDLLPLHIACAKDASRITIQALLNAYEEAIFEKTYVGKLPLHVALANRALPDVIELLLETYSKKKTPEQVECINIPWRGLLPIHLACWKNCPEKTVSLLLERDASNETIDKEINIVDEIPIQQMIDNPIVGAANDLYSSNALKGMIGLHLALSHGATGTVLLLLQKERQRERSPNESSTIEKKDCKGCLPLHIACQEANTDPIVIKELLDLDAHNKTTHVMDDQNLLPLHYACSSENPNAIIIQDLIEAEDEYLEFFDDGQSTRKRSVFCVDSFKRTPLKLAIMAGASQEALHKLLAPRNFTMTGMDLTTISMLSERVAEDRQSQDLVIEQFVERPLFAMFFVEFILNIVALITFISVSEKSFSEKITISESFVLWSCISLLLLREVVQMWSQKGGYWYDYWSLIQLAGIFSLFVSVWDMHDITNIILEQENDRRIMYIITGSLLVLNFIFFLRAAFLPFARFVGGLVLIFQVLIPFFLVTGLLLLLFAYDYHMYPRSDSNNDDGDEENGCSGELGGLGSCYLFVLNGFFGSDATSGTMDIIFGIVVVVVLLNVVIAIVCEAWDSARTEIFYWNSRIQWLASIDVFDHESNRDASKISRFIDSISWIPLASPTNDPYEQCSSKEEYDDPKHWKESSVARRISQSRSLESDIYWIDNEYPESCWTSNKMKTSAFLKWSCLNLVYAIFVILGFATFGLLFPQSFRRQVLMAGI